MYREEEEQGQDDDDDDDAEEEEERGQDKVCSRLQGVGECEELDEL